MSVASWGTRGTFTREAERQRRVSIARRRAIEAEVGRAPRADLDLDDDLAELPDEPPPGYARAGGWR